MPQQRPRSRQGEEQLLTELGRACLAWLSSPPDPSAKAYQRMRQLAARIDAMRKEGEC